jgi:DHA3 family macrolide efflux protein-like MFS transporter
MSGTRQKGFLAFIIVWVGQVVSLFGTNMTRFALTIWTWQITGRATDLALIGFFSFAPSILVSPLAGALVDRWDRRLTMMLSDLAAAISTIVVLVLFSSGNLQISHLYVTNAFAGFFQAFQFPAYSVAITMMVPKKHYGRASGMLSMADFTSNIFAPVFAALLLTIIGINGILIIDIATFLVAIIVLFLVHIPQPSSSKEGSKKAGNLWRESLFGFKYISKHPGLLGLQLVFFFVNLTVTFAFTVISPMVLTRSGNEMVQLGTVQSALGVGGMLGSIVLSVWGGPKRRIHGVLGGLAISMLGLVMAGLGRGVYVWTTAAFIGMFFIPITNGSSQAIWQSKTPPDIQGRVFAARSLIAQVSSPVSMLLSGPLADNFFEPGMMPNGALAPIFGVLTGTGPGAGMALMFIIAGTLGVIISIGGYAIRVIREVEDILPDA